MGQKAVAKGYVSSVKASNNYLKNYQDSQQINGIKFRYYIDKDTKGVTNVHPYTAKGEDSRSPLNFFMVEQVA